MADWKTHIIVGTILSLIFIFLTYSYFNWEFRLMFTAIPIIIYYSLLPDIDHRLSKMTAIMLSAATIFIVMGYLSLKVVFFAKLWSENLLLFGIIILVLTVICSSKFIAHRGRIHTVWLALLSPLILLFIFPLSVQYLVLFVIASISYWSHLLADGIPLKIS